MLRLAGADEQRKHELAKTGASVVVPLPKTLAMLLEEFFRQHVDEKLAPKTIERYHEQAAYLATDLLNMPIAEITQLHLSRERNRLLESGWQERDRRRRPSLLEMSSTRVEPSTEYLATTAQPSTERLAN